MFKAKLNDVTLFKKLINAIKDLNDQMNFCISETGISLQAYDISHIALISINLFPKGFEEYKCTQNLTLGIRLSDLHQDLKFIGNEDSITLLYENNESELKLISENESKYIYFINFKKFFRNKFII